MRPAGAQVPQVVVKPYMAQNLDVLAEFVMCMLSVHMETE